MVSAPYNFVPLAKTICTAEMLSKDLAGTPAQDIPEKDGTSGVLSCTVTCTTRLLIGDDDKKFITAPEEGGKPVIPGSSLRGMIRNVMEIASFARMQFVDDQRVGVRDLYAPLDYGSKMSGGDKNTGYSPKAKAGFLSLENGSLKLQPCDFARIEHRDLDMLAPGFSGAAETCARNPDQDKRIAKKVEALFRCKKGSVKDVTLWVQDKAQKHEYSSPLRFRRAAKTENAAALIKKRGRPNGTALVSQRTGRLVFTGLPNDRKHLEFFFFNSSKTKINVPPETWKRFIAVHEELEKESETWAWRKKQLYRGTPIPVFWLPGTDGAPEQIGLAMMFKIAADNSIHEMISHTSTKHSKDEILDLPTRIFGQVADEDRGFRTRVSFGWAELQGTAPKPEKYTVIAARPKPSFVPSYVRQRDFTDDSGKGLLRWKRKNRDGQVDTDKHGNPIWDSAQYRSYMNWPQGSPVKEEIRGWKRYPVGKDATPNKKDATPNKTESGDAASTLYPLPGTAQTPLIFEGKIRYHNLHPIELGALVWALTWGGNDTLRHSLGMGRPYGWGQVKITLEEGATALQNQFTEAMERAIPGWANTPQIRQLLAMADPAVGEGNKDILRQMVLDPDTKTNEFRDAKKHRGVLPEYNTESVLPFAERIELDRIKINDGTELPQSIQMLVTAFNNALAMQQFEKGMRVKVSLPGKPPRTGEILKISQQNGTPEYIIQYDLLRKKKVHDQEVVPVAYLTRLSEQ